MARRFALYSGYCCRRQTTRSRRRHRSIAGGDASGGSPVRRRPACWGVSPSALRIEASDSESVGARWQPLLRYPMAGVITPRLRRMVIACAPTSNCWASFPIDSSISPFPELIDGLPQEGRWHQQGCGELIRLDLMGIGRAAGLGVAEGHEGALVGLERRLAQLPSPEAAAMGQSRTPEAAASPDDGHQLFPVPPAAADERGEQDAEVAEAEEKAQIEAITEAAESGAAPDAGGAGGAVAPRAGAARPHGDAVRRVGAGPAAALE